VIERGSSRKKILTQLHKYDLIIINYALLRREAEILCKQPWLCLIIDEAQAIKNPKADITQAVKKIEAAYRFALTGTPIENRLLDLWSIADYVMPGYLGSLGEFTESFGVGSDADPFAINRLRARLRPIMIRRLKTEVAPELPDRIEERLDCEMAPAQRTAYLSEVKRTRLLLKGMGGGEQLAGPGRIQILAALTRLRQMCCDPQLLGLEDKGSGKVEEFLRLVPPLLEAGHKVLVFSQFVKMLNLLRGHLEQQQIPFYMLTGQTTKRQAVVERFENDPVPSVFLISLKAGGTGLNLTSAAHVVLFDPWWNPAVEAQAIDRTHRIGQDKTVVAFRLVMEATVEERIFELQEKKRNLVKGVLDEDGFNRQLGREDFEYLLAEDAEIES
jgi:SNF2 family DNA or RNA helicase